MNKTKIEWCDSTWNPVTGCRHGCEYCYARRVAGRFGKQLPDLSGYPQTHGGVHCLDNKIDGNPYPYIFEPTLHAHRLDEPQRKTKPQTIFVCSMADLFGSWVPDEWIKEVFAACERASQHRYLFLTKAPQRYVRLMERGLLPKKENMWYGASAVDERTLNITSWTLGQLYVGYNTFVSLEPLLGDVSKNIPPMPMHDTTQPWSRIGLRVDQDGRPVGLVFAERKRTPYDWYSQPELDKLADQTAEKPAREHSKPIWAEPFTPAPQKHIKRRKRPEVPEGELPAGFYGPSKRR